MKCYIFEGGVDLFLGLLDGSDLVGLAAKEAG